MSDGSNGLHRNDFQPPLHMSGNFSKSLTNRKYTFPMESIRVQWIQWTPSERLSTPSYNMSGNFSKSLTNRKYAFPVESIRVRWIQWTPSERLSTPSYNMSGNFSKSLTNRKYTFPMESIRVQWITYSGLIGLFTTRFPVFQWKARGYDWSLVDSIGQPSNLLESLSKEQNCSFL